MTESKIYFKFDGKKYAGNEGDTIAAALLRNNVRLIGRSFKYHRPRGIYTCGIEEPNALVQIINEHNGIFSIKSNKKKGTLISISLPKINA